MTKHGVAPTIFGEIWSWPSVLLGNEFHRHPASNGLTSDGNSWNRSISTGCNSALPAAGKRSLADLYQGLSKLSEKAQSEAPVAVFDSGIGGLSVLQHLPALLPGVPLLYLADQAHVPYGLRPAAQVRQFLEATTQFFLGEEARLIVIACNTATAAALNHLRATFPHVSFVGMEPAVKPAARQTRSGKVGVLATAGTFESERYTHLTKRFAGNLVVLEDHCEGLVSLIEQGRMEGRHTEQVLRRCLEPMLGAGVDTVVLGCTHYPFVLPLIRRIVGPQVAIIDPAPAVARQTRRVWQQLTGAEERVASAAAPIRAYTTGDPARLEAMAETVLGYAIPVAGLLWKEQRLVPA